MPPDTIYIKDQQLLADQDYILLTIEEYTVKTYCKILNVKDGSITNIVSCDAVDHNLRNWSSGSVDSTSVSLTSVNDLGNGNVAITISRNGSPVTLSPITSSMSGIGSIGSYIFVDNSINSVFIVLYNNGESGFGGYYGETIQIIFPSETSNYVTGLNTGISTAESWFPTSNKIITYQNSKAMKVT